MLTGHIGCTLLPLPDQRTLSFSLNLHAATHSHFSDNVLVCGLDAVLVSHAFVTIV